jgi:regulator of cell morphogenesis and NO signaling
MQNTEENFLDVTQLEPRQKHPTIFGHFDDLAEGESLTIHNDHDPKPLYYQLLGERGNIFKWDYLEQGPEWWKVKISKHISGQIEETLGQIAARDLRKAQTFIKYGLDFCCNGKRTLKEACAEKGLDILVIDQELQRTVLAPSSRPLPYNDWGLIFLIEYIVNTHHHYVVKNLPEIMTNIVKVMRIHGSVHSELSKIHELVKEVNAELTAHLMKEEKILFPYIKELVTAKNKQKKELDYTAQFGTIQSPINMMEMEHELVGKHLAKLRELSNNYSPPEDACASYSLVYRMLDEFEEDLHLHIHLENNILFPKAIELEKQLNE